MMIKVCGMRDADNMRAVEALGVNLIGMVFYSQSKRAMTEKLTFVPTTAQLAGVFVNADPEYVVQQTRDYNLRCVQLHGDETLAYVSVLRKAFADAEMPCPIIVRAIAVENRGAVLKASMWDGYVDGILFETPTKEYGGCGVSFDWSLLTSYRGNTPFFLAGGIGPQSLEALKNFEHPMWTGVDLNSRFENGTPGIKDVEALRTFITELREAKLKGSDKVYR